MLTLTANAAQAIRRVIVIVALWACVYAVSLVLQRIVILLITTAGEQMQFELWTRFALPFVRLGSVGIQRIRQKLPANRNPFAYFKRAIVSIDTLKSDRYLAHLEARRAAGCENAMALWRELRALGFAGTHRQVHRWLADRRTAPAKSTPDRWRALRAAAEG